MKYIAWSLIFCCSFPDNVKNYAYAEFDNYSWNYDVNARDHKNEDM